MTFQPRGSSLTAEAPGGGAPEGGHMAHWLDCVQKCREPNANVVAGHPFAMACHIAKIACRERQRIHWQKEWEL